MHLSQEVCNLKLSSLEKFEVQFLFLSSNVDIFFGGWRGGFLLGAAIGRCSREGSAEAIRGGGAEQVARASAWGTFSASPPPPLPRTKAEGRGNFIQGVIFRIMRFIGPTHPPPRCLSKALIPSATSFFQAYFFARHHCISLKLPRPLIF
jgi:hypothetical protein